MLLTGHTEVDELKVCRFASDVFTIIQQDYPVADQGSVISDPDFTAWGCAPQASAISTGGHARPRLDHLADQDFRESVRQV